MSTKETAGVPKQLGGRSPSEPPRVVNKCWLHVAPLARSSDVPHVENKAQRVIPVQKGTLVVHELRNLNLTCHDIFPRCGGSSTDKVVVLT